MATLAAIEKKIAELKKKADALRSREIAGAVRKARAIIDQFGLTAEDLGLTGKSAGQRKPIGATKIARQAKSPGIAKYRDPVTGKTWTGVGRAPQWISGAADRSAFLIESTDVKPTKAARKAPATKKPAPRPPAAKKATAKTTSPRARKRVDTAGTGASEAVPG